MQELAPQFPFHGYDWSNPQFLGEGSFGKVYKVRRVQSNEDVAVKQIDMRKIDNEVLLESLVNQMKIMREIQSPHTVRLFDSNVGQHFSYMILELCDSDLRKKMESYGQCFPENECLDIFGEIIQGIKILVDHSYIHRDIKPANVLVKNDVFKIADYGFAMKADFYGHSKINEICGTPIYMAPQLLCNEPYNEKCDIWSLGLMLYELLFGCPPWPIRTLQSYVEAIMTRPLSFPYNQPIGNQTKDFLIRSLTVNEERRMTWPQLFDHEIVKSKIAGDPVHHQQIDPAVRHILSQMQFQVERKRIDLLGIFKKYQQFQILNEHHFFSLLFEISPAITTYESRALFQFCDKDKNGAVEFNEFKELFCHTNFHEDPILAHYLNELACIITVRKINLSSLFDAFDKNHTNVLDHGEFRNFLIEIGPKFDENYVQKLYKVFDKDQTGVIDKREFIETIASSLENQSGYGGIDIERAKRNEKGLKNYLIQNGIPAEKFMEFCDKNMDAHINEKQFKEAMEKVSYGITEQEISWIFKHIDANNSGTISMEELFRFLHL